MANQTRMTTLESLQGEVDALEGRLEQIVKNEVTLVNTISGFTQRVNTVGEENDEQDDRLTDLDSRVAGLNERLGDLGTGDGDATTLEGLQETLHKLEGRLKTIEDGGGGADATMLQMVKADLEKLKPMVDEAKKKADKFDGRLKAVEDGGGGGGNFGLKGKPPVFSESDMALGLWKMRNGQVVDEWERYRGLYGRAGADGNFRPVDVHFQGETLVAFKVLMQDNYRQAKVDMWREIPLESHQNKPFSFGLELFLVEPQRSNFPQNYIRVGAGGYWQEVLANNNTVQQQIGDLIDAPIDQFTDEDGNRKFITRVRFVVRDAKAQNNRLSAAIHVSLACGDPYGQKNTSPVRQSWIAMRPLAT